MFTADAFGAPPPRSFKKAEAMPWVERVVGPEDEPEEPKGFYPADLPKLEKDPFGWTPEELKDAVKTAQKWRDKGE